MERTALKGFLMGSGISALALLLLPTGVPTAETEPLHVPEATTSSSGLLEVRTALDRAVLASEGSQVRYVVVELSAAEVTGMADHPVHLSLVLDTSGSMDGKKLRDAKAAAAGIINQLGPQDSVSIVGFSNYATVYVDRTMIQSRGSVLEGVGMLHAAGGTNMYDGIVKGLDALADVPQRGVRRLVVLGDGHANEGPSDVDSLAAIAAYGQGEGITVSALGLGVDFDVTTMAAIADAGGGRYHYVESPDQLASMLTDELREATQLAAHSTTVEIRPGAGVTVLDVFGYESWDGHATVAGWEALVGDMAGGAKRKVVAKLQIDPTYDLEHLAEVHVSFIDPVSGQTRTLQHQLSAVVSDDPEVLASATDERAVGLIGQVHQGRARDQAAVLRRAGQADEADQLLARFSGELLRLSGYYRDESLALASTQLEDQRSRWRGVEAGSKGERSMMASEQLRALGYVE